MEVIEDVMKPEVEDDFTWQARIPMAPRKLVTVFYYFLGHGKQTVQEVMEKSKVRKERLQQSVEEPTDEMVDKHELMGHSEFKPWCKHCVGGRSRGEIHKRVVTVDERVFEGDYTFYSQLGYDKNSLAQLGEGTELPNATCVLNVISRKNGTIWSTVCLMKGAWQYAVEGVSYMIQKLKIKDAMLRADPEPAMKTVCDALAARALEKGCACMFQQGQVGSHQSIGACEQAHDVQAGYVRTIHSFVFEKTGVKIHPKHVLFPWLIRYVMFVMNCLHVRPNGLTAYKMEHGVDFDARLATFGEQVLFQIGKTTMNPPGKGVPRWAMGTVVGFPEAEKGCVCVTPGGYEMSRTIH